MDDIARCEQIDIPPQLRRERSVPSLTSFSAIVEMWNPIIKMIAQNLGSVVGERASGALEWFTIDDVLVRARLFSRRAAGTTA